MLVVRLHGGQHHVRGRARRYWYHVASLFEDVVTGKGHHRWRNTGVFVEPFRSYRKTVRAGRALARARGADFMAGYGSLHNRLVLTAAVARKLRKSGEFRLPTWRRAVGVD